MENSPDLSIAEAFRRWGHLQASIDPLGQLARQPHRELDLMTGDAAARYRFLYCGPIGAEFMHLAAAEQRQWIIDRLEGEAPAVDERWLLSRILRAEVFERFIHTRYVGSKRFSIEGLASLIPLLDSVLEVAAEHGYDLAVIGMPHRGRLNVIWSIVNSPAQSIFACFEDVDPESAFGRGDVKYHRGATGAYPTRSGHVVRVRLSSNPSHLEATDPVVLGRVKARQERLGDLQGRRVLPILIHGDAAFAGQGIAAETLNLSGICGYSVGGTVHIIANNLIGFTAPPAACYGTRYASDLARRLPIPIFHVNAEEPKAVARIGSLAMNFRHEFLQDVVIDLIGYRRFGHNEGDDPTFTSPVLYKTIQQHPFLYRAYASRLGVSAAELQQEEDELIAQLASERELAQTMEKQPAFFSLPNYWEPYFGGAYNSGFEVETAVSAAVLVRIGTCLSQLPPEFRPHPKIAKLLEQRREMAEGKRPVDWGMAEALAFGTLLSEGTRVRLTGQDTRRGTFSHRHAVLFDLEEGHEYTPLEHIGESQAKFHAFDTILSEAAVVGFEYGYSRDYPETLVCWEAQFGDFANGAQTIIDQFISAGEDKWGLLSGLVLLLPHGYEGAGPEHSSARLERFLQLCAEDNLQVAQPSTAAQYFHLLRRQALRKWLKPLVVMTPKSMLRHPYSSSPREQLSSGKFELVLQDDPRYQDARRLLLCSGKIVHELRAERERRADATVSIVSLEQLYPFPEEELAAIFGRYRDVESVVWVQEEPANMGALFFVREYLEQLTGRSKVSTVRRSASASPATGSAKAHEIEQRALINLAFSQ